MKRVKEIFEGYLIDVKKEQSPSFHLREFNYLINDVINEVITDVVLAFEKNQKSLDYLKGIKRNVRYTTLEPSTVFADSQRLVYTGSNPPSESDTISLPPDYRHITGVTITYKADSNLSNCTHLLMDGYTENEEFSYGTKRLNDEDYSLIVSDPHQRPRYFNPFHAVVDESVYILTGKHDGLTIKEVNMNYLKTPEPVILTYAQAFQDTQDNSQILEFDEIFNRKILDRLVVRGKLRNGQQDFGAYNQISNPQPMPDIGTGGGGGGGQQPSS